VTQWINSPISRIGKDSPDSTYLSLGSRVAVEWGVVGRRIYFLDE
jgi:hypothetical protein